METKIYSSEEKMIYFEDQITKLTSKFVELGGIPSMLDHQEKPTDQVRLSGNVFDQIVIQNMKSGNRLDNLHKKIRSYRGRLAQTKFWASRGY